MTPPSRIARLRAKFRDPTMRRVLVDARITTFASIVGAALNIVRSALVARLLGVTDFGRLALVVSTTVLLRQLVSVRTWEWVQTQMARAFTAKDRDAAGAVMKAGYVLGFAVNGFAALLVIILAGWLSSHFLDEPALATVLRVNALLLVGTWADDASSAALRVVGRFRWLAGYAVIAASLRLAVIAPVWALGGGLMAVVVATVAAQVLCSVWQFAATRRFLEEAFGGPLGGRLADMRGQWRAHVRTLVILGITDTLKTISTDADNLIIGAFHSPATVGPFRAAQTIVAGLHQLATPLYMVYYPEMSKAVARGEPEAARRLAGQIGLLGLLGGGAAAAMLTIAAPWLVPALYGPGFDAAVPAMQLMAWSLLVIAVGWANPLFVSTGRPALTLIMIAAGVVVKLALLLALVPGLPNLGAAIAFVGSYAAVGVASIVLARVVLGFRAGGA